MTFFVSTHAFRGFSHQGGSLYAVVILGWVSFGFAPYELTQKLSELTDALKKVVGK